ncbi:hypothetical protein ACHWQZ_G015367 [Mnemiopsis leidyi]
MVPPPKSEPLDYFFGVSLTIFAFVGGFGNYIAVLYFWRKKRESFPDLLYFLISTCDTLTSILTIPPIFSLFSNRSPSLFRNHTFCNVWTLTFKFLQRYSRYLVMIISVTRTIAIVSPFYRVNKTAVKFSCGIYAGLLLVIDAVSMATGSIFVMWSSKGPFCIWTVGVGVFTLGWDFQIATLLIDTILISLIVFGNFLLSVVYLLRKRGTTPPSRKHRSDQTEEETRAVRFRQNNKIFRHVSVTISIFTAVFLICNLPLFCFYLLDNAVLWFNMDEAILDWPVLCGVTIEIVLVMLKTATKNIDILIEKMTLTRFVRQRPGLSKSRASLELSNEVQDNIIQIECKLDMADKESLRKISSRTDPISSEHIQKLSRWRSSSSLGDGPVRRASQTKLRAGRAKHWHFANKDKGLTASQKFGNANNAPRPKRNLMETTDTEIHELFQLMDVNKDQKLAPKELDCVLRALGINATEADLIEFIGELPTLEEGQDKDCVTYEQFAESIKKNMALTNETDSLQVTFNAFDHAGDGFIDTDKLKSVLSNLGLQFQDTDIQNIIHHVGTEGRISFDEFQRFMLNCDDII